MYTLQIKLHSIYLSPVISLSRNWKEGNTIWLNLNCIKHTSKLVNVTLPNINGAQ